MSRDAVGSADGALPRGRLRGNAAAGHAKALPLKQLIFHSVSLFAFSCSLLCEFVCQALLSGQLPPPWWHRCSAALKRKAGEGGWGCGLVCTLLARRCWWRSATRAQKTERRQIAAKGCLLLAHPLVRSEACRRLSGTVPAKDPFFWSLSAEAVYAMQPESAAFRPEKQARPQF